MTAHSRPPHIASVPPALTRRCLALLIGLAACGGGRRSPAAAQVAESDEPPQTGDAFVGCTHDVRQGKIDSFLCDGFQLETLELESGGGAAYFDEMTRSLANDGRYDDIDDFAVQGRHYAARRVQMRTGPRYGLLVHTQVGSSSGRIYMCSAVAEPAKDDRCRLAIVQLIARGLPPVTAASATILGVPFQVARGCTLAARDVKCSDQSRLSWNESLDRKILLDDLDDALGKPPRSEEAPCSLLGEPATCRRSRIELPDQPVLHLLAAVITRGDRSVNVICSWFGEPAPAAVCRSVFGPPPD